MAKIRAVVIILLVLAIGGWLLYRPHSLQVPPNSLNINLTTMKISSPAFLEGQTIPKKYTCDGQDINPPLIFTDVPQNTKSLVLIVDDPDAPSGLWTHWTVWNIPPHIVEIAENSFPPGATQGITSAGTIGYHGPCPPSGTHHYVFHLLALDRILDLSPETKPLQLWTAIDSHVLTQAVLTGLYSRD